MLAIPVVMGKEVLTYQWWAFLARILAAQIYSNTIMGPRIIKPDAHSGRTGAPAPYLVMYVACTSAQLGWGPG